MNPVSSVFNRNMPANKTNLTKRPWAVYLADNYAEVNATLKTGIIPDVSSNNRSAATTLNVTKTSSTNYFPPILQGTTTSKIIFPNNSLPPTYTILCVSRYSTSVNRNRILASPNVNFTHGHYEGGNSKFYNNNTSVSNLGSQPNSRSADSWCVAISTNSTITPLINACGVNNNYFGIGKAGTTTAIDAALGINNSRHGTGGQATTIDADMSDFEFHALVIYDQGLTVEEMTALSATYMANIRNILI